MVVLTAQLKVDIENIQYMIKSMGPQIRVTTHNTRAKIQVGNYVSMSTNFTICLVERSFSKINGATH